VTGDPWKIPESWEEAAVGEAIGPRRWLGDRAPREDAQTPAYLVKAWWATRIAQQTTNDVARRWHASMQPASHAATKSIEECGCRKIVRRGIKEVSELLLSRV
jgi:hypothetical protein